MAPPSPRIERPLSPHLQIYRPVMTMMMSIAHRITGAALYFGSILLIAWLLAAAAGPDAFLRAQTFMGSPIGLLLLFGFTWALFHHALGGIRHLIWDTGRGMDAPWRDRLAYGTLIGSVALTILFWIVIFLAR
jgi:succinate dehydrogenase / fumarate reductase cytochrome b subunit